MIANTNNHIAKHNVLWREAAQTMMDGVTVRQVERYMPVPVTDFCRSGKCKMGTSRLPHALDGHMSAPMSADSLSTDEKAAWETLQEARRQGVAPVAMWSDATREFDKFDFMPLGQSQPTKASAENGDAADAPEIEPVPSPGSNLPLLTNAFCYISF